MGLDSLTTRMPGDGCLKHFKLLRKINNGNFDIGIIGGATHGPASGISAEIIDMPGTGLKDNRQHLSKRLVRINIPIMSRSRVHALARKKAPASLRMCSFLLANTNFRLTI